MAVGGEAASGSTVPAGRTVPCTDPNPIRRPVELRQLPVMTTESPSSRNFRVWPLPTATLHVMDANKMIFRAHITLKVVDPVQTLCREGGSLQLSS